MEIRFDNTKSFSKKCSISNSNPLFFKIFDSVEGDINVRIRLSTDDQEEKSYTNYSIIDSWNSEVQIFNAPKEGYVTTDTPIVLGTLLGKYKLMLKYNLSPIDIHNQRAIQLDFYLEEK